MSALGLPLWVSPASELFVARTTLIVQRGNRVHRVFEQVDVNGHVDAAVLASLRELAAL